MIGVSIKNRPRLGIIHKPFYSGSTPSLERTFIGVPEAGLFQLDSEIDQTGNSVFYRPKYLPPFIDYGLNLQNFYPSICASLNEN